MLSIQNISLAVQQLASEYPIDKVELFGSYATGMADENSDVDVLVKFKDIPITLLHYYGFQEALSEKLNTDVDLVRLPLSEECKRELVIDKVVELYDSKRNAGYQNLKENIR